MSVFLHLIAARAGSEERLRSFAGNWVNGWNDLVVGVVGEHEDIPGKRRNRTRIGNGVFFLKLETASVDAHYLAFGLND